MAGWACAVYDSEGDVRYEEISDRATELLELDEEDATTLFDAEWPVEWAEELGIKLNK